MRLTRQRFSSAGALPAVGREATMKRLAYVIFAISSLVIATAVVLLALSVDSPATGFGYRGWSTAFALSFVVVGLLITANRPENAIGWVLAGLGLAASLLALGDEYGFYGIEHANRSGAWGAWLGEWFWVPLLAGVFVVIPLIFPNGRLLSRRWRAAIALVVVASALGSVWLAFAPGPLDQSPRYTNPAALAFADAPLVKTLGDIGLSIMMASMALGALSLVIRFRRSQGTERQQIKWLAFSVSAAAAAFLAYLPFGVTGATAPRVLEIAMQSMILAVPVCIGIAVLRYRLYEIDRIISRTLSYAIVTIFLGGTFALVTLLPTALVGSGGRAPDWIIAGATLSVAALFRPVRRRARDAVDRRFNRKRYDSEHTVEAFAQRLREEIDIDALGAELCAVASTALQPSRVSLWLARTP